MSTWSCEEILFFLECYQTAPSIWNPKDKDHKVKKKVADAWNRLSEIVKKPVKELKNKKEILMATFRKHLKKKQDSIRSGSGAGEIYEPTWFAYPLMESFLLPVYTSKMGINSETQSLTPEPPEVCEIELETDDKENYHHHINLEDLSNSTAAGASIQFSKKCTEKSRHRLAPQDTAEKQMATAFSQLTNALSQRHSPSDKEDDECDLYAKLLAKKLRELRKNERKMIMYEIDGLFIKKINRRSFSRETPSPQYFDPYTRPPSAAHSSYSESIAPIIIKRPRRAQTSFSDTASIISSDQPFSAQKFSYVPMTPNIVSNFNRTSTPLQPSAQNMEDGIIIYSTQPNSSNPPSTIDVLSEQITAPAKKNLIEEALLNAYEKFENHIIE